MFKQKYVIDTFKLITIFVQFFVMFYYKTTDNVTMWIYIALHGVYGILWVLKSNYFGDKSWEAEFSSIYWAIYVTLGLFLYWSPGIIISSKNIRPANYLIFISISIFTFGVFFHCVSDLHKTLYMELMPKTLLKTKLWSLSR